MSTWVFTMNVRPLGKTQLAFALLHSVLQDQICLLLQVFLDFLLLYFSPLQWEGHLFWMLVLEGLVGLHRTFQLQSLQHYWLGHRLGLSWYWIAYLGNEQRSFCHFRDCTHNRGVSEITPLLSTSYFLRCPNHSYCIFTLLWKTFY